MKLKYILPSLLALFAGAAFTACDEDFEPTYLSEVKVSSAYVSFPAEGSTVTIDLQASQAWAVDAASVPEWLTISPMSGDASVTEISFVAGQAEETRSATVLLNVLDGEKVSATQRINVQQVTEKQELPITPIATVCANPDGTYRIKGVVTSDPDNEYGNWNIQDETGTLYIYGTCDMKGNKGKGNYPFNKSKNSNAWDITVGDEVVVEGPAKLYGATVELVDVTVISYSKSLVKVDSLDNEGILPIEGGELVAHLTSKGNGLSVVVPDNAKSWLSVTGIVTGDQTATVTFSAPANAGGDRSTTVTFVTTQGGQEYTSEATISQTGAILEVSVAEFVASAEDDTQYRITGIVTELYASDSQGQSFYVSDYSGTTLVYRAAGFKESGAKVGDVVTFVGKHGSYKGTAQVTNGTFEQVKYAVTEVTIAEFLAKEDNKEVYYMVTGTVSSLLGSDGKENDYGNLYITDGTNELYVYGTYPGWGATGNARKGFVKNNGIEVGDKLTLIGYKDTYKGLVELCGTVCFSFEKGKPAQSEDPNAPGTLNNPFDVAGVIAAIEAGTVADEVYVKGIVSEIANNGQFGAQYGNGTFWISADGVRHNDVSLDFEAFRVLWLGNKKWVDGDDEIKVGDEVVLCGQVTKYTNQNTGVVTYETSSGKAYVYSVNGKTE